MTAHVVASAAAIDWPVVLGGAATFLTTAIVTWQGLRRGREKVAEKAHIAEETSGTLAIRGGVLMDNYSMIMLKEQLVHNCETMQDHMRCVDNNTNATLKMWEQLVELKMEIRHLTQVLEKRN
jgi:hypothetical protein